MTSDRDERLERFVSEHGELIRTALAIYADNMREESLRVLDAYASIAGDPARRAAQDKTLMTTRGLRLSGEILADAAYRAERALTALADLTDEDEDDTGGTRF
jgi:uncharacterized membrane protein YccC